MRWGMGQDTSVSAFAAVYLRAGTVQTAYAWKNGVLSRAVVLGLAAMGVLFGFVVLAPLMPIEFIGLVSLVAGNQTLAPGIVRGDRSRPGHRHDVLRPYLSVRVAPGAGLRRASAKGHCSAGSAP